jgi:hypothetical protein
MHWPVTGIGMSSDEQTHFLAVSVASRKKKDIDLGWRAQAVRRYPYQSSSLRSDGMSLGSKSPSCVTSVATTSSAAAAARRSMRPFSFPFGAKMELGACVVLRGRQGEGQRLDPGKRLVDFRSILIAPGGAFRAVQQLGGHHRAGHQLFPPKARQIDPLSNAALVLQGIDDGVCVE